MPGTSAAIAAGVGRTELVTFTGHAPTTETPCAFGATVGAHDYLRAPQLRFDVTARPWSVQETSPASLGPRLAGHVREAPPHRPASDRPTSEIRALRCETAKRLLAMDRIARQEGVRESHCEWRRLEACSSCRLGIVQRRDTRRPVRLPCLRYAGLRQS